MTTHKIGTREEWLAARDGVGMWRFAGGADSVAGIGRVQPECEGTERSRGLGNVGCPAGVFCGPPMVVGDLPHRGISESGFSPFHRWRCGGAGAVRGVCRS